MNNRDRIINTVLCKPVDRLPYLCEFGPWEETLERWSHEGMPHKWKWKEHLGLDRGVYKIPVELGFYPEYERKVLVDEGDTLVIQDRFGVRQRVRSHGSAVPQYLEFPVKNMDDWNSIKEARLNPDDPGRYPADFGEVVKTCSEDYCVRIGKYPFGLFGTLRELMGVEEFLVAFYEDPELIHDMMDHLTDFWIKIYDNVSQKIQIDWIHIWEDMSGKQGSLISPDMVREFMIPNYKKITDFAKKKNIPIISVDTDGNCSELVPLFLEAGINLVFPFEVSAGSDIVEYREKYPLLGMMGGIDKLLISGGEDSIKSELQRIRPVLTKTGYIPMLDHGIPPEVSWDQFNLYMSELKRTIIELEGSYSQAAHL